MSPNKTALILQVDYNSQAQSEYNQTSLSQFFSMR